MSTIFYTFICDYIQANDNKRTINIDDVPEHRIAEDQRCSTGLRLKLNMIEVKLKHD